MFRAEELPEICRIHVKIKEFWEISASVWYYCKETKQLLLAVSKMAILYSEM